MLTIHSPAATAPPVGTLPAALPATTVWLDLLDGTDAEKAYVERVTGLRVPTLDDLREIESSSRLVADGDVLHLSMPMITGGQGRAIGASPLGLVLSPRYLLTVRFAPITPIDTFAARFGLLSTYPAASAPLSACSKPSSTRSLMRWRPSGPG